MASQKQMTFYRDDFKIDSDGDSYFDTLLCEMDIPAEKWGIIHELDSYVEYNNYFIGDEHGVKIIFK